MKLRRLALVGGVYVVVTVVVLGVGVELARLLVLPPLFRTLLGGIAVLGLPLALIVAWVYEPPREGGDEEARSAGSDVSTEPGA